jgi:hypothetical protein
LSAERDWLVGSFDGRSTWGQAGLTGEGSGDQEAISKPQRKSA